MNSDFTSVAKDRNPESPYAIFVVSEQVLDAKHGASIQHAVTKITNMAYGLSGFRPFCLCLRQTRIPYSLIVVKSASHTPSMLYSPLPAVRKILSPFL